MIVCKQNFCNQIMERFEYLGLSSELNKIIKIVCVEFKLKNDSKMDQNELNP